MTYKKHLALYLQSKGSNLTQCLMNGWMDGFFPPAMPFCHQKAAFPIFLPSFLWQPPPRWLHKQFCRQEVQRQEVSGLSECSKEVLPRSSLLWLAVLVAPRLSMVLPSACVHVSGLCSFSSLFSGKIKLGLAPSPSRLCSLGHLWLDGCFQIKYNAQVLHMS